MKLGSRAIQRSLALLVAAVALMFAFHDALAARRHRPVRRASVSRLARARGPSFASALVVDAESGQVLYQKDPHQPRAPASLAKMMLELLTLEALREGRISLDDPVRVPEEVRKIRGTRVRLRPGEQVSVRDLLYATAIASANDAAATLAIHLAGTTEACVAHMNRRARALGMLETHYENVHGLDRSGEPGNVTTAWDLAILSRRLLELPEALEISSTVGTTIRTGQVIHTTNRLLGRCPGVDGLKTGYTSRSGHCLVATAKREGLRLISVVLGARSNRRRFSESAVLIDKAYDSWSRICVVAKGQDLGQDLPVREGRTDSVRILSGRDLHVLVPAWRAPEIRVALAMPASTRAPIAEGWTLGRVQVFLGDSVAVEGPAIAGATVQRTRVLDGLLNLFQP